MHTSSFIRYNELSVFLFQTVAEIYLKSPSILQCVKSVHIRSFSGPYFPAFGNTERYYSLKIALVLKC